MKKFKVTILLALQLLLTATVFSQDTGCTDATASNFNPLALIDDNSCCYSNWLTLQGTGAGTVDVWSYSGQVVQSFTMPGTISFCLESGCYALQLTTLQAEAWTGNLSGGGVNLDYYADQSGILYFPFIAGDGSISGCTDPNACNFSPQALCDNGMCSYDCYGCTNPSAVNFDPQATIDNGTCCTSAENWVTINASNPIYFVIYDLVTGFQHVVEYPNESGFCFDQSCLSYQVFNNGAILIDFSLVNYLGEVVGQSVVEPMGVYNGTLSSGVVGCSDSNACNFNPEALCYDPMLCDYSCFGCTDPNAPNYDSSATVDNGTCCNNDSWMTILSNESIYVSVSNLSPDALFTIGLQLEANVPSGICMPDGCYNIYAISGEMLDASITITNPSNEIIFTSTLQGGALDQTFSLNAIDGCLDPTSCNYNPNATCTVAGSCDYSCQGCTDPNADNYSPVATTDNGSCCYGTYTINMSSPGQFYVYSNSIGIGGASGYCQDTTSFCIPNSCFLGYAYSNDGSEFTLEVYDANGLLVASASSQGAGSAEFSLSNNAVEGCTDVWACNFNPEANCATNELCAYACYGCTDPSAPNFNPNALIDDGSCCTSSWYTIEASDMVFFSVNSLDNSGHYFSGQYPQVTGFCLEENSCFQFSVFSLGAMDLTYTIYGPDGSVFYQGNPGVALQEVVSFNQGSVVGCTEPSACNYNPIATCSDWNACDYSCYGCTDPTAINYDAQATLDNGTCCTADNWYTVNATQPLYFFGLINGGNQSISGVFPDNPGFCAESICSIFYVWNIYGGTSQFEILNSQGVVVFSGSTDEAGYGYFEIAGEGEVAGCTEPTACNYNPNATCNNGSCYSYCGGCTDPLALNYSPASLFDDGTCFYTAEAPGLQVFVEPDQELQQYYVRMDMIDLGNGSPYMMTNDQNLQIAMIDSLGYYYAGPFQCGQNVTLSLNSMTAGNMQYMVTDPLNSICAISVQENQINALSVFPNPTNADVTIDGLVNPSRCDVFDMTGRKVMSQRLSSLSKQQVDLNSLSDGAYQLMIIQENSTQSIKVMVRH
jgi:Secretion system C-terminal sorting domain